MLVFAVLILIPISIIYSVSYHYASTSSLEQFMIDTWQRQSAQIAKQAKFAIITASAEQAQSMTAGFEINQQILNLSIYKDNKVIYAFGGSYSCGSQPISSNNVNSFIATKGYWCFYTPVFDNGSKTLIGGTLLVVSKDIFNLMVQNNLLLNSQMLLFLISMILILIVYLTRFITKPLSETAYFMVKTKSGSRGLRIKLNGPKEIRNIQLSYNEMINSLEKYETKLETLVTKRTIELTSAYQTAQAASEVKSDILHIVSHEMKTPLHNIKLPLEVFLSEHNGIDNSHIMTALGAVAKLNDLIQDLLIYAKGVSGSITPYRSNFGVNHLLNKVVEQITPSAKNKGNKILIKNLCDIKLFSDEKMLGQILLNLLSNANKFTLNGKIEVSCQQQKDRVMVSISDTGCGIDQTNIDLIFQPFYQADMSPTRSYAGTGLGLAICKLFAETLGGSVSVESQINSGSIFFLRLPIMLN